ncbi:hypothetical protein Tco_0317163 [Tanacetum coccineum]
MTSKAQQIELDNAVVAPENCHVIGKCNMRINPGMKSKEPTYQVVLDALSLTTCYPAFLITAEVLVIYMHRFWATVDKHKGSYRFKIDNKKFFVNVEVFRDILNICPRILGQEFDEPPTEEEALYFIHELGHSVEIKYITDVIGMYYKKNLEFVALIWEDLAYQIDNIDSKKHDKIMFMHTAKDDSLLGTMRFISRHAETQVYGAILLEAMMNQALLNSVTYKTYYVIASGAEPLKSRKSQKKLDSTISSEESPSKKKSTKANKVAASKPKLTKKKAPIKADRGKGLNVLSEVTLPVAAQLKKVAKRSKKDYHISHASGSGDGTDFESGVPDEQHRKTSSTDEGTEEDNDDENDSEDESDNGDNDDNDDGDNDANDDDNQEDDDKNDDEEETDSDRTKSDRIKILGNKDVDMTDADQGGADKQNVSQESGFEQVEEDAHVTLTPVLDTQKTDEPVQSSSVSSDFTSKLLNLENPSLADNEIPSLMDTIVRHEEPRTSDFATPVIEKNVTESLEATVLERSSSQPKSTYEAAASLSEFELTKILIDNMEKNKSYDKAEYKRELYDALVKSYQTDKDLFDTYGEVFTLKRSQDDKDKDQDPSARPDRGMKRRKSSKEAESSRDSRSKENKSSSTSKDASHSQHKPSGKSAHVEEPSHTVDESGVQQNQEFNMGNNDEQPANKEVSKADWFKKPERPPIPDPDWNKRQHVDFRPPQTWISQVARAKERTTSFDELINTLIDFSAFVLNRFNVKDLTQAILVGPTFDLLKVTCKPYPFNLSKPLPFIPNHQGRQVIPQNFFINNDLEYLKGGDLSRRYSTSVTKTKAATYEIKWIEDSFGRKRLMRADELHKLSDGTLNDVRTALYDISSGIRMEFLPKRKWSRLDKKRARVMAASISLYMFELTKILIDKMEKNKSYDKADYKRELYDALVKSYQTDKDLFDTYEEPSHTVDDSGVQQNQEFNIGNNDEQLADKEVSKTDWFKKPERPLTLILIGIRDNMLTSDLLRPGLVKLLVLKNLATTERLDWHNPKGKPYLFDLSKPLSLIPYHPGHQVIPQDYFINNDLDYLKGGDLSRQYSTFVTKTKAATYEIKWIEDLVHNLWSPVKVIYDKHAYLGTSHWGPKRQRFYGFASNMTSSKDVYSIKRIIIVTRLTIMKKYDYGHLEEIEVCKED